MKNFYIFFIAFLISSLGFGQDNDSSVSAPVTQVPGGNLSSLLDTPGEAVDVFAFDITDSGDSDGLSTLVTRIRLKRGASSGGLDLSQIIEGITLDNTTGTISSVDITPTTIDINFDTVPLEILNGTTQTLTVGVYFKSTGTLVDGGNVSFFIDASLNNSGFTADNSGSTFDNSFLSNVVSNSFIIDVEATQLTFLTQPSNVALGAVMTPAVEVGFTDENENVDVDLDIPISISGGNLFSGSTFLALLIEDGVATFDNLIFLTEETNVSLLAEDSAELYSANSIFFDVTSLPTQTIYTYTTGTWSPSNPNGVSQSTDKIVLASGDAHITADTFIYDIQVQPGTSLTVDAGVTLTVVDNLTLNSQSNSYSSFIYDGVPTDNFTNLGAGTVVGGSLFYKRYVNSQANGNDLISPPFVNQDWSNFLSLDTNSDDLFNDGNTDPKTYLFGPLNKNTLLASNIYVNWNDGETKTLASSIGYRAATVSGTTLTFSGRLQRESLGRALSFGGIHFPDWNLVGNPFPSYISIADFLNYVIQEEVPGDPGLPELKNIDLFALNSGIYGYDGDLSNGWDVITDANAGTRLMAPGQGFLVPANPDIAEAGFGGGQIIFDPSMRKTGSSDDFISGRNAALTFVKMKAYTATKSYNTQFYFNENSSLGLDHGYDGKILGAAPSFALYSNAIGDETQLPLALQSLHTSDLTNTTIPLGVKSNAGQQITFTITEMNLPSTVEVYLEDTVANTFTLLNDGDYTITPISNLNGTGRFYLRFGNTALSTIDTSLNDLQIYTDYKAGNLVISGNLTEATSAKVYDIEGRLVNTTQLAANSQTQTIDMSSLSAGVYVVQLANRTQSKTQKVIWR